MPSAMIKQIFIFLSLMFVYFPKKETHNISSIEAIGISGAHVFLFFITYLIFKIYSFHIERMFCNNRMSKKGIIIENIITFLSCFTLPIFFIRASRFYYHSANNFTLANGFFLLIVFYLLLDRDRKLRLLIVKDYEKRIERWGHTKGVFFTGYPPQTREDITFSIILIVIIVSVVVLLSPVGSV